MERLREVEAFVGKDAEASERAFLGLSHQIRQFLRRYLSSLAPDEDDRDDVIAVTLERIWTNRSKFQVRGEGQWWAYVATVGRRCAYDLGKAPATVVLQEDIANADYEVISWAAHHSRERAELFRLADESWLGWEAGTSDRDRNRQLLAAQLHYLDARPWAEICEIVGVGQPLSRTQLDQWLAREAVLRSLCYNCLYVHPDELVRHLLADVDESLDSLATRSLNEESPAPPGWTWQEIRLILWHYRNGLRFDKMCRLQPGLSEAMIEQALARVQHRLPFASIAEKLVAAFRRNGVRSEPLRAGGLWRRLAFEYHVSDELTQKQILDRTLPAAEVAGFKLTDGMLNVWISSGRLMNQICSHARRVHHG